MRSACSKACWAASAMCASDPMVLSISSPTTATACSPGWSPDQSGRAAREARERAPRRRQRRGEGVRDFLDLATDPELVELIADAIGDDVILWGCQVFCKPAGDGLETPWH